MHAIGVSTVNALTAHKEWATRPPDERYESVRALQQAALTRRLGTEEHRVATGELVLEAASDDRLALKRKEGSAALKHWSSSSSHHRRRAAEVFRSYPPDRLCGHQPRAPATPAFSISWMATTSHVELRAARAALCAGPTTSWLPEC